MNGEGVNWSLEVFRIGIPVATTIFVGWLISRSNEKYKSKLARDHYRYQDFYPRMTATIAELYRQLSLVERSLDLSYRIATDDLYKQMPDARHEQFQQTTAKALQLTAALDEFYPGVRVLLDPRSLEIFDGIIEDLGTAAKFIRSLSFVPDGLSIEGDGEVRMWNTINEILRHGFPERKGQLEAHVYSLTQV
jgi:hypothetical protein